MENFETNEPVKGTAGDGNLVTMYARKILDKRTTEETETLTYMYKPYVEIISPGQKHAIVDTPIKDRHKKLYPLHWDAFQKKEEMRQNGTSLRDWHGIEQHIVAELEYLNVYTVEDLANVSDGNLGKIGPGAVNLKKNAQIFVAGETESKLQLDEANERIKALEEKLTLFMDAKANPGVSEETTDEPTDDSSGHTEGDRGG